MNEILKNISISTIAVSGGGKTVYTYGVFKQFYAGANVADFFLEDTDNPYIPTGYNYKKLSGIKDEVSKFNGPHGTGSTTIMDLDLCKSTILGKKEKVLSIEWMDYAGGLLNEFAKGNITKDNVDLYNNLTNSHVLIVFTDASLLKHLLITKKIPDINTIREKMGADTISLLLNGIEAEKSDRKKRSNEKMPKTRIMFVLTKFDAANIDQYKDKDILIKAVEELYYLARRGNVQYEIYPVGVYGVGNTITSITDDGIVNACKDHDQMLGYNVKSSFAQALCMAIETAIEQNEIEWRRQSKENEKLRTTAQGKLKIMANAVKCFVTRTPIPDPSEIQQLRLKRINELNEYKNELSRLSTHD